ncbi:hypothetical protein GOP47_0030565, partial [Adiantum capillus-veneris]
MVDERPEWRNFEGEDPRNNDRVRVGGDDQDPLAPSRLLETHIQQDGTRGAASLHRTQQLTRRAVDVKESRARRHAMTAITALTERLVDLPTSTVLVQLATQLFLDHEKALSIRWRDQRQREAFAGACIVQAANDLPGVNQRKVAS